jgi:hypothetical protein
VGGINAIIIDPQVGDIGIAIFGDRDLSSVIANKAQSNPGSLRRFDMADGLYIGGFLSAAPSKYVRFYDHAISIVDDNVNTVVMSSDGVTITDKFSNKIEMTTNGLKLTDKYGHYINMNSSGIDINGNVTSTGTFQNNSVNISSTHVHGGVQSGGSNTAVPH